MRDLSRDDSVVKFRGPGKRARSDAKEVEESDRENENGIFTEKTKKCG